MASLSLLSLILSGESFRICWSCGWGWGWFRGKEILRSANFKHMFPPSIGGLCFCLFVHIQHCLSGLGWKILDTLLRDEKKRFWWRTFLSCASQLLSGALTTWAESLPRIFAEWEKLSNVVILPNTVTPLGKERNVCLLIPSSSYFDLSIEVKYFCKVWKNGYNIQYQQGILQD